MAIKSFSGTRMKIKCCRGLIKATQNIITLVQQQQQWMNAAHVIIINFQPRHYKFNASTKAFFLSLEGLITLSLLSLNGTAHNLTVSLSAQCCASWLFWVCGALGARFGKRCGFGQINLNEQSKAVLMEIN
jgi:hypothetical protein